MEQIKTLSSLEGRKLLYSIYQELRYEKQLSNIQILILTWRICTTEREISRYIKKDVQVLHPLGFFAGTALWMEEFVNRFYFSTINSFVYFGAAILLVLIGIRRFSSIVSDTIVIAGVVFEALMLLFMFVVMLFTPSEDALPVNKQEEDDSAKELLYEIGEISTELASAVTKLESLGDNIRLLLIQQNEILSLLRESNEMTRQIISPNPKLLETMELTNNSLQEFTSTIETLTQNLKKLEQEQIELTVRRELENFFVSLLNNKNAK
ncbi:MAG: hypothetical protein N2517_07125 [Ignavibacteria bacterium]|nr:hypothetical protein [Ignavibacteria bacterium]